MNGFGAQRRADSAWNRETPLFTMKKGRTYGHGGRKEVILSKTEYKDMNCLDYGDKKKEKRWEIPRAN